jgi:hypothetical protein
MTLLDGCVHSEAALSPCFGALAVRISLRKSPDA